MKIGRYYDFNTTKWFKSAEWKNHHNSNISMLGISGADPGLDLDAKLKREKDKTNK